MATRGQGRPVAVLASGLYQAELRERMAVPPSKALKRTWQDTGWGWEPCPGGMLRRLPFQVIVYEMENQAAVEEGLKLYQSCMEPLKTRFPVEDRKSVV